MSAPAKRTIFAGLAVTLAVLFAMARVMAGDRHVAGQHHRHQEEGHARSM